MTLNNLPQFTTLIPNEIETTLDQILENNRAAVKKLVSQPNFTFAFAWDNLMQPLEAIDDNLTQFWGRVSHLNAVINSPALREAYNACLPKVSVYSTEMAQNIDLYNAIKSIADGSSWQQLNAIQQKIITEELRDFHLAGVDLPPKEKKQFADLQRRLSELMNKFEENVLDATQGWVRLIKNHNELKGIPDYAVQAAAELAQQKKLAGWLFTLEAPSFLAIMAFADNRKLREEMYQAYVTRASDQGPNAGRWDNSQIMQEILQTRHAMAQLLGFPNYAELSLATKTAKNPADVLSFLNELAQRSLQIGQQEFEEQFEFAKNECGIDLIQPWDMQYVSEKLRQKKYALSQDQLRPYFQESQVLQGLFAVVERLFGLTMQPITNADVWHSDVKVFAVHDSQQQSHGYFYMDLYARENKRSGAWMDECRGRRRLANGEIQLPIIWVTCNFSRPIGNNPALWIHEDVLTLFHEFGHALQGLLSKVDYANAAGTSNVPWDVVEFPSQFMENWCWEKPALDLLTKHYQTGETLPDDLFQKLHRSKIFHGALQTLRQLEFALFDFRLHLEFNPADQQQIQRILNEVRGQLSFIPAPSYNRFQHSFTHIFGGSYGAGYYSYKWAEVWACDAYAQFEENGVFDHATGQAFLHDILERGSAEDPLQMFIRFRGRAPKIDALLRQIQFDNNNLPH